MIGQTVSNYKIVEKLGEGGMGVVYKAEHLKLGSFVALKFLSPHLGTQDNSKTRFIHEAKAASSLEHPNIGSVYDIGETPDGQMYIVMPCYEGETLQATIDRRAMDLGEALDMVGKIASGLAKAHEKGITHRDIKPGNILVTEDGHPKILDFGLAKLAGQTRVTRTGTTVGTVAYMSPEQARGDDVEPRSDVFSLGVVLYELLTGFQPFGGDREAAIIYSIMNVDPEPLQAHRPDLPAALQNVIDKALSKDPQTRYQNASDFLEDLEQVKRGEEVEALKPPRPPFPVKSVMTAVLGAVVVVAAYLLYSQFGPGPSEDLPPLSDDVVAVFPFTVRGGEDVAYMGEGMVELLGMNLDGVRGLRSVDANALLSLLRQSGGYAELVHEAAAEIAGQAGAGRYVKGTIVESAGRLNIRASLYETRGDGVPESDASVEGETRRFADLVDELAADLVAEWLAASGEPTVRLARQTTSSFEALKAYLEGESLYRSGEYGQSAGAFKLAVTEDTTFALAYYWLKRASMCANDAPLTEEEIEDVTRKMMRFRDQLPDNERRLIEANQAAWTRGDAEAAIRLLRENVSDSPDDLESRSALAEILFHYGRRQGLWQDEVTANCQRILMFDPDHLDAIATLHWQSGVQEKHEEALKWVKRRLELEADGDHAGMLRAEVAFAEGDSLMQQQALEELQHLDDMFLWFAVIGVAKYHGDFRGGARIARLMVDPSRPPEARAEGHINTARLAVARGRWNEAEEHLSEALPHNPDWTIRVRGNLSIMPQIPRPSSYIEESRDLVYGLSDFHTNDWQRRQNRFVGRYLAGMLSARLGDPSTAMRYASQLDSISETCEVEEGVPRSYGWKIIAEDFAHTIRAEVAWAEGNAAEALAEIEQTHPAAFWMVTNINLFFSETYQRYMRGFLLAEVGRIDEALRWLNTLGQGCPDEFLYFAPKHLKIGEIYERLGDQEKALDHYHRFLKYWQDCDPEYRSLVADVTARIARLKQ